MFLELASACLQLVCASHACGAADGEGGQQAGAVMFVPTSGQVHGVACAHQEHAGSRSEVSQLPGHLSLFTHV